jgi:mono/diheme cytochrome c family protein
VNRRRLTWLAGALGVTFALALAGCPSSSKPDAGANASADAGANASADAGAKLAASTTDGKPLVAQACLSCHSEHMLAQQRLTEAQWTKTVTKMVGWGANLDSSEVPALVAYLSANYGPAAGPYTAETITADEALAEMAPLPDDPFPAGDPEKGKATFIDKCSGCHGQDARGGIGVLLVERPILYRAADLARMVRKGRGKMLPLPLTDAEIGDVLAYLRRLRNPLPKP